MKTIVLSGPVPAFLILAQAIRQYADAAYPPGGSECAQSAREGLLDAAHNILDQVSNNQTDITISRRIKSHIKAAIQYYLQVCHELDIDPEVGARRAELMLQLLSGDPVDQAQWESIPGSR